MGRLSFGQSGCQPPAERKFRCSTGQKGGPHRSIPGVFLQRVALCTLTPVGVGKDGAISYARFEPCLPMPPLCPLARFGPWPCARHFCTPFRGFCAGMERPAWRMLLLPADPRLLAPLIARAPNLARLRCAPAGRGSRRRRRGTLHRSRAYTRGRPRRGRSWRLRRRPRHTT